MMIPKILLWFVLIAVAAITGCAFLIGEYNRIIRMRRDIVNEALQLDFALRKYIKLLESQFEIEKSVKKPEGMSEDLHRIEALSCRGSANPILSEGMELLMEAAICVAQLNLSLGSSSCVEVKTREQACLYLTEEYNRRLRRAIPRIIAMVCGFKPCLFRNKPLISIV